MKPHLLALALLAAALFLAPPVRAALPDGLYTTQAPVNGGPTPVGFNGSSRSGFTLAIPKGWRLAQPILPLDFTWLKPWIEGPGVIVRVRGVAGDNPPAAAALLAQRWPGYLSASPFRTGGGLQGMRVLFGAKGRVGQAAYLLPNRPGFVYAFVAEPWPRGSAPFPSATLPGDALMKSAAWERQRVGYRP